MKIGFLTPEYPLPGLGASGGIGTSIRNLTAALEDAGHSVVIFIYGQPRDTTFSDGKTTIQTISRPKFKGLTWLLLRRKIQRVLNACHRRGEIDLVEAPDWTGISAFISPSCPVVVRLNGSDTYFCSIEGRKVKPFNRFLERRALLSADGLVSVSAYTARMTKEIFSLRREFTIIPNSVDMSRFTPSENAVRNKVLYFGTLIRKKGVLEIPGIFNELIKKIPDAELWLVGRDAPDAMTGSRSTWALMQTGFTGEALKNVTYSGGVPYADMMAQIASAAVCIFPSFAEALPVSWLEAMAMGKAVVASDIGWAPEIITDGKDGFLVSPTAHAAFAEKIAALLSDTELLETTGKAARGKIVSRFANGPVAEANISFYQSLLRP